MMRALLLTVLLLTAGQSVAVDEPVEVIQKTNDQLARLVDDKRAYRENPEALKDAIKDILMPTTDQLYTARLVLGRHARGKDDERIQAFADALANQLLERYATALLEYNISDRVEVLPLAGDNTERLTRVRTRVRLDNDQRAPVDYVMRKTDEGWQVFDVIVEGISYVATFRSQINQEIRQSSFEDMLERLQAGEYEVSVDD